MNRLLKLSKQEYKINDLVKWKNHPYDDSIYVVKDILDDDSLFIDNGEKCYTNIKPSKIIPV